VSLGVHITFNRKAVQNRAKSKLHLKNPRINKTIS